MNIAILEFIEDFNCLCRFAEKKGLKLEDFIIVALDLKLQSYLKKQRVSYKNTLTFFTNDSHRNVIINSEKVMQYLAETLRFTVDSKLNNVYVAETQFHVRFVVSYLLSLIEILEGISRQYPQADFFGYVNNRFSNRVFMDDTDRFLGKITQLYANGNGLRFTDINDNCGSADSEYFIKPDRKIFTITAIFDRTALMFTRAYIKLVNKKVILIPGNSYGFDKLKKEINKRVKKAIFVSLCDDMMNELRLMKKIKLLLSGIFNGNFWINLKHIPSTDIDTDVFYSVSREIDAIFTNAPKKIFSYKNVNFANLLEIKISEPLKEYINSLIIQTGQLCKFIGTFNIKLIISPFSRGIWDVAGALSRILGIKSLFVSHAASPAPIDEVHEIELLNLCRGFMLSYFTHIAISTPIQERHLDYFKRKYKWIDNQPIKTGPLIFANLSNSSNRNTRESFKIKNDEIVMVHAVIMKSRRGIRFYFVETWDEYISGLTDIMKYVQGKNRLKLILRLHQGFDITDEELLALLPKTDNCRISRSGSFESVLAISDLLISYSSTCIDEALLNKVPVLLYDKWNRYNHFKANIFEGSDSKDIFPVCYCHDPEKLKDAISYMINKCRLTKREEINVSRYKYSQDYSDNFYRFVKDAL